MNWAVAVFGAMLLVAIGFWFTKGKRAYLRTDGALGEVFRAAQLESLVQEFVKVIQYSKFPLRFNVTFN
ncbi:uncharacterized protein N7458_007088 [Penicillium daleae]|uniref:Uncharacterized protein n=1 Tax=Penicillium daleae TaxID=63821 RepID=A0AAD6G2P0_9EURO|nr:uncharacterized protein N7458_007088 [Penicillium daleae]KAJ5450639.1 hypothetical protein N7458_007088 [Penicillium daleae]